ncbi:MAG: hypothetical protein WBD71_16005 [Xanthobacteraceae bacterium]
MSGKIRQATPEDERETEDQMARRELGPRGQPDRPDTAAMTPQREKKLPKEGEFDGHTA